MLAAPTEATVPALVRVSKKVDWKHLEGQSIDGVFPLIRLLRANTGAVFETRYSGRRAAIKLVVARLDESALSRWKAASTLEHPHLLKIFAGGECDLHGENYLYVVTELADDDLSQVLGERKLTPQETQEMLGPVAGALAYLHGRGYVLGSLEPSTVMAIGDRVKLPLDHAIEDGDPAQDCHALGVLLCSVLAAPLPEPFREIADGCMAPGPSRWTAEQVATHTRQSRGPVPVRRSPSLVVIASALVLSLVLVVLWRQRAPEPPPAVPERSSVTAQIPAASLNPAEPLTSPKEAPPPVDPTPAGRPPSTVQRVMPEIPRAARDTIQGRVTINVKIQIDPDGNVSNASPEPPPASKYFTERVLAAAREWKFAAPAQAGAPQEWILRFQITRTEMIASMSAASASAASTPAASTP